MWYVYTMEYYPAIKKNEMPFAATWMDLEGIMLSEISQRDKYCMISLVCGIYKTEQMNKQTESQIQRTNRWLPEGRGLGVERNR